MVRNILSKPICHLLLVISLGILGYSNTLNVPFQFDDTPNIVTNPIINNLDYFSNPSKAKVYKGSVEYFLLISRYIGSLSFALNYKIHGLNVIGYHVVNLLIHLINSLLIYWFVNLILITPKSGAVDNPFFHNHASTIALFTSLLFVTHPIQTQAVTYIVQRFASLATMFYLLSISMYVKARLTISSVNNKDNGEKLSIKALVYFLISLFASVLAMKTKEISFTLPAMIVLSEFLFFKGETKSRILYLVPFLLTMLIIPATLVSIADLGGGTATKLGTNMPRLDYLFTEFRVIITYLRLIFFPVGQNLDYDYPLYHSIFAPEVLLSFLALLITCLTVIYSFWRYRKTLPLTRVIFFCTVWFFVTLSVESSVIPIVDVIFEHRMYLPSLGIFLLISIMLVMIIKICQQNLVEETIFLSVVVTAVVFTGITYSRNNVWSDKIVLWQDVVSKSPEKERGYINLASAYYDKGDFDNQIKALRNAININPSNDQAYAYLGIAYFNKGLVDEAIKEFRESLRINPRNSETHIYIGTAYGKLGRINESIKEFREAMQINPHSAEAHNGLGIGLYGLGRTNEAIKEFKEALRINPDNAKTRNNLEVVLGKFGRINEATE
jgi:Tfp pilus assembly protein PilF